MGKLDAWEAKNIVRNYDSYIDSMKKSAKNNFEDMDFENADRRNDMEKLINSIISECNRVKTDLDNLPFY